MSYNERVGWVDRQVERPRTYFMAQNGDGSYTLTVAPGTVTNEGTPVNATNLNAMDKNLQDICVAFDLMYTTFQAEIRDLQSRVATLEAQVTALT